MVEEAPPAAQNPSKLKSFLASIATMSGDLSNITVPPFVLASKSVIEIPSFWGENPSIFISPVKSEDPAERALLMLRSFLCGLRSQCYMGHSAEVGVKKPLNAFLGELFVGRWEDENGTTHVLSEQVSHHPPITACRIWNDEHGVVAEGYNRQSITFNGSVNIKCIGHVLKSLTKYDEHYLFPIPDFRVKGLLSTPYPETSGTYYIPSNAGYTSVVHFAKQGMFSSSSKSHAFTAHVYKEASSEEDAIYTIEGHWDTEFTVRDNVKGKDIEVVDVEKQVLRDAPPLVTDPIEEQDPWESRNAWNATIEGIKNNNMSAVGEAKTRLEQGQRAMREDEKTRGKPWQNLFFRRYDNDKLVEALNAKVPNEDYQKSKAETDGIWKFDSEAWNSVKKPYHGSLRPDNTTAEAGSGAITNATQTTDTEPTEPQPPPQSQQQLPTRSKPTEIDHTIGAVEDGRSAEINGPLLDVGREPPATAIEGITKDQPAPQTAQQDVVDEHRGSGIEGMSMREKNQVESLLREQYSSAAEERKASHGASQSA